MEEVSQCRVVPIPRPLVPFLWYIKKGILLEKPPESHCNKNPIYVFLFWGLCSLSPNFQIHVSVSNLYIPGIGLNISCSRIRHIDRGNI